MRIFHNSPFWTSHNNLDQHKHGGTVFDTYRNQKPFLPTLLLFRLPLKTCINSNFWWKVEGRERIVHERAWLSLFCWPVLHKRCWTHPLHKNTRKRVPQSPWVPKTFLPWSLRLQLARKPQNKRIWNMRIFDRNVRKLQLSQYSPWKLGKCTLKGPFSPKHQDIGGFVSM